MVSRFREELRTGVEPEAAALKAVSTAGRTVLFAGIAIATAMFAALEAAPGSLLLSSALGICIAAVFSVVGALTALPATLVPLGPGWGAPYEVIVASRHGPITDTKRLKALAAFQSRLSRRKDVTAVMGPGEIAAQTSPLESVGSQLAQADGQLTNAIDGQNRL